MNRTSTPHRSARRSLPIALACTLLAPPLAAGTFRERGGPVEVAVYDYEVAIMCGLADARVQRGFQHRLRRLLAANGMDRQAFERARMRGWTAADREWSNRGLGGFRGWCRTEGTAAAEAFAAEVPAADPAGGIADR